MGKKILVIDEDRKTVGLFGKALEPHDFNVYAIGNPDIGIEKAIEIEPDLIFIDLIFKESNGLKVSKLIHAVDKLKKVPIVMFISHRNDLNPKYTATIGVVDVLIKPFTADDILAKTFSVLHEDTGSPATGEMSAELTDEDEFEAFAELAPDEHQDEHQFVKEADDLIDQAILGQDGDRKNISGMGEPSKRPDVVHLRRKEPPVKGTERPADYKTDKEIAMKEHNLFDEDEGKKDDKIKKTFQVEPEEEEKDEIPWSDSHKEMEDFDDEVLEEEKPGTKKKIMMAIAGLLVIAGLGVAGYQIKKSFFSNDAVKVPAATAPARTETVKESLPPADQVKPAEPPATAPAPATTVQPTPVPKQAARNLPAAPSVETARKEPAPKVVEKPKTEPARPAEKKESGTVAKDAAKVKADFKFSVQTGSFENEKNAVSAANKLKEKGYEAFVLKNEASQKGPAGAKILYRVLIGRFENIKKAEAQAKTIKQKEGLKVIIYRS